MSFTFWKSDTNINFVSILKSFSSGNSLDLYLWPFFTAGPRMRQVLPNRQALINLPISLSSNSRSDVRHPFIAPHFTSITCLTVPESVTIMSGPFISVSLCGGELEYRIMLQNSFLLFSSIFVYSFEWVSRYTQYSGYFRFIDVFDIDC